MGTAGPDLDLHMAGASYQQSDRLYPRPPFRLQAEARGMKDLAEMMIFGLVSGSVVFGIIGFAIWLLQ